MDSNNQLAKKQSSCGYYLLIIVIGVDILLMAVLVWIAESHRPELVEPHYYTAGSIDSVKRVASENRASGWIPTVRYTRTAGTAQLSVSVYDTAGKPVNNLTVTAGFYRPSSELLDRPPQPLVPDDTTGYVLTIQPPLNHGLWDVLLTMFSVNGKQFHRRFPIQVE